MGMLFELVFALLVVGALFFYRCERVMWTTISGVMLVIYTLFSSFSWLTIFCAWAVYLAVSLFFAIDEWRYRYLSEPVLKFFRKALPPLSETEKIAMDAGDVWWDGDLFSGSPQWEKLLAVSKPTLSEEEQSFIDDEVETLCQMLHDHDIVACGDLPPVVWSYIKDKGFWGLGIPKNYGGKAFSALAHSTVVTKIASRSTSAAVTVMVPNSLGPGELIQLYGTEEQKNYYLPRLAKGIDIPCFALTGTHAGSDAGSITDAGVVCYGEFENKKTLGIKLTWDKRYITLAPVATVLGL
ncbi:MAG: acyl-CoA dehydrogenase family protein, partial [Candidatus Paceibacterales bacterium]